MNIRKTLERQGVYDPILEKSLIDAINQGQLDIPCHSIPMDPAELEEQEWLDQLNLGPCGIRKAA